LPSQKDHCYLADEDITELVIGTRTIASYFKKVFVTVVLFKSH